LPIEWSAEAIDALERISARIAWFTGDQAAQRWRRRVTERIELLALFPFASRRVPEFDIETFREVYEGEFRIHFLVQAGTIYVATIFHGSMSLEDIQ
jgi:plasmid stabilization system protein ParE